MTWSRSVMILMCAAVKDLYDDTRVIFEPAGALAVAGLKEYAARKDCRNKKNGGLGLRREHEL